MLKITDSAEERLLGKLFGTDHLGIRISVTTKGCSGMSYRLDFITEETLFDEKINDYLYVDIKSMPFLIGMEIDAVEDDMSSRLVFRNPNEKGRCGCSESFYV